MRLGRRIPFARHVARGTRFSGIGQIGLPVARSSTKNRLVWSGCASAFTMRPLCGMSHRMAAQGTSSVPQPVMHHLIVPFALAGHDVDRDDAFGEEIVAGAMKPIWSPVGISTPR